MFDKLIWKFFGDNLRKQLVMEIELCACERFYEMLVENIATKKHSKGEYKYMQKELVRVVARKMELVS